MKVEREEGEKRLHRVRREEKGEGGFLHPGEVHGALKSRCAARRAIAGAKGKIGPLRSE